MSERVSCEGESARERDEARCPEGWQVIEPLSESERECRGHCDDDYSLAAGLPMGQMHYCDGSCRKGER